ncbi:epoxide hydrolase family protein [Nocardia sp. NPDC057440]|uniref:epoxide hydrolase family protein n=1 Tax=Nocardia sp. NPDC057440 TaxID=3346134 RepID=UPI00366A8E62
MSDHIEPFTIQIPQEDLYELQARLARTRHTDEVGDQYGFSGTRLRGLVERWTTSYDWRAWEAKLNTYPQFTTTIDGQRIHFLHVRSAKPDALALLLTHGWPGSIVEYLDVIDLLSAEFHLVIPSVPGFGFSGPTTEPGWGTVRTAKAWVELMRRLGYDRYGAVGNDGGSVVSPEVGRLDPEHVVGVHVTQIFSFPSGDPAELVDLTGEEGAALGVLKWFWEEKGAFNVLHSQQPQTLAHALADSPAGLLAWNAQLFDETVEDDFVLTNTAIYWFTGTAGSAIRFYYEDAKAKYHPSEPTTVPLALCMAASGDFASIRRFAERDHANIVSCRTLEATGHYLAHTHPNELAGDVNEFFAKF